MFLYKSCPRCRGDLNLTLDEELACLQCGHEIARPVAKALVAEHIAARQAQRASAPAVVRRAA
jgi:hypothetical protein